MTKAARLMLKPDPDGFGFLYGTIIDADGASHRVDFMPPLPHWRGDMKLTGAHAPHPSDWVIYADGEEIARVRERGDIEAAVLGRLAKD